MRLVFVLYAEDRGLMPRGDVYQKHYSISGLFERLRDDEARYLLPVITECMRDDLAETVLSTVTGEQKGAMKESASYHIQWARRVMKAFDKQQRATGPIALGDLVTPLRMVATWPSVAVDAQYNKTGIVDLDTGEPKYFGAGFLVRLEGLSAKQSSLH